MSIDKISVAVGDEFTVSLQSIATAGYLWKIESLPDAVHLLGTENDKAQGDRKPGDSTDQIFRFRARETGEHEIKFTLSRLWEKKAIETKTVTVKVINPPYSQCRINAGSM
jgi:predicted secreted protein